MHMGAQSGSGQFGGQLTQPLGAAGLARRGGPDACELVTGWSSLRTRAGSLRGPVIAASG
jgi:hypothetical protein